MENWDMGVQIVTSLAHKIFLCCTAVVPVLAISCNDILREGSLKDFTKDDLITLSSITPQELETCLFILGKDELTVGKAEALWSTIKQIYGSVFDVPEISLKQLGWIISGIPVDDFYNITIPDIDMVTIFGSYRNLTIHQLTALKISTENQWSRKTPEQLTSYDLSALKQILCAFNDSEIAAIHPDSYRDAANELATLRNCPKSALKQLANLAVDETAFGNPSKWNSIQITSIGCVMSGLTSAEGIPKESMEGITPHIVQCLPGSFLQTMSAQQLQHFTTNAASAVTSSQKSQLSSSQKSALEQAITGLKYIKHSRNDAKKIFSENDTRHKLTITDEKFTVEIMHGHSLTHNPYFRAIVEVKNFTSYLQIPR